MMTVFKHHFLKYFHSQKPCVLMKPTQMDLFLVTKYFNLEDLLKHTVTTSKLHEQLVENF